MRVVYFDEAGYTGENWQNGIKDQPFYVLASVAFDINKIRPLYEGLRKRVDSLHLPECSAPLGLGFEIKAKDIAKGTGWWQDHNDAREAVRQIMLSFPKEYDARITVIVVNKQKHYDKYSTPENPYLLSLQFAFERLQLWLDTINEDAICVYDQNKRLSDALTEHSTELIRNGSYIEYFSDAYHINISKRYQISRLLEFTLGDSRNSAALQIADFFASMTYQYYKSGKPEKCEWWKMLQTALARKDGVLEGVGLKEFP
jgi:hypothetical protein